MRSLGLLAIGTFAFLAMGSGCSSASSASSASPPAAAETSTSDVVSTPFGHRLEGFEEDLLVASPEGKLSMVHVGAIGSRRDIAAPFAEPPREVECHHGRFFLLYADGTVAIVGDDATITRTIRLPVPDAQGLALVSETVAWVSSRADALVRKVDLVTGAVTATVDLASVAIADGKVAARYLRRVDDRLFVQVARRKANGRAEQGALAVIDLVQEALLPDAAELTFPDQDRGERLPAIEPDLPMTVDRTRGLLYVSAMGRRPANTGGILQVDVKSGKLTWSEAASGGFQGIVLAPSGSPEKVFTILHTSTPTTSSHLFERIVGSDGALGPGRPGAIVDTFDGLDALATNESGTLVAMANTCLTGFCFNGAGVAFVDVKTLAVLPKLKSDALGFEPSDVYFRTRK